MAGRLLRVVPHGVMLLLAVALYWAAGRIEAETGGRISPAVWPKAVIVFMGVLCAYEIVKRLLLASRFEAKGLLAGSAAAPSPGEDAEPRADHYRMLAAGIAIIAAYVLAVPWVGFFTATALFLILFPWAGGVRRPVLLAALGLGGTLVLAVVFLRIAYVSLPLGEGPFRALSLALLRALGVS